MCPGIVNAETFESELQSFLKNRDQILACADTNSDTFTQYDAKWFVLLFAIPSSGAQCLSIAEKEANLNSKVFGKSKPLNPFLEPMLILIWRKAASHWYASGLEHPYFPNHKHNRSFVAYWKQFAK